MAPKKKPEPKRTVVKDVKKNGYTLKMNKYKKDMFRPQPDLRVDPKSRRHHPIMGGIYCGRRWKKDKAGKDIKRCANSPKQCERCCPLFAKFKEKK